MYTIKYGAPPGFNQLASPCNHRTLGPSPCAICNGKVITEEAKITGITPALSDSCRKTVHKAIEIARKNQIQITFDPNLRFKLWDKEEMRKEILNICNKVDIILPGLEEGKFLFQEKKPESIINNFLELGAETVVLKLGADGAMFATQKKDPVKVPPFAIDKIVDPVGAGDGFAAGLVSGLLQDKNLYESTQIANAVGAFALTVRGDVEGFPTQEELDKFLGEKEEITR